MGLYPIRQRVTLVCRECGGSFESKRRDTRYCVPCRQVTKLRQTKESNARNRLKRNAESRDRFRCRSQKRRDEIKARLRQRYANDLEYRERKKASARESWHLHGVGRASYALQRDRSVEWRRTHKNPRNGQQTAVFRKESCECCGLDDPRVLNVHHKIPYSKGGLTVAENLETLCRNCHAIAHFEMSGS